MRLVEYGIRSMLGDTFHEIQVFSVNLTTILCWNALEQMLAKIDSGTYLRIFFWTSSRLKSATRGLLHYGCCSLIGMPLRSGEETSSSETCIAALHNYNQTYYLIDMHEWLVQSTFASPPS